MDRHADRGHHHMARSTWRLVLGPVLALLVTVPAPAAAQSPAPIDGGVVLLAALRALDTAASYRFEVERSTRESSDASSAGPPRTQRITGVRIQGPEFRARILSESDGLEGEIVVVGDQGWLRVGDGELRSMADELQPVPDRSSPVTSLVTDVVQSLLVQDLDLTLIGPESIEGVDILHYTGGTPEAGPSPDPTTALFPTYAGTVELWVDAHAGHLVRLSAEVILIGSDVPDAAPRRQVSETITVEGVDDPANTVEPPVPAASG